jgi:hypothetical protein
MLSSKTLNILDVHEGEVNKLLFNRKEVNKNVLKAYFGGCFIGGREVFNIYSIDRFLSSSS